MMGNKQSFHLLQRSVALIGATTAIIGSFLPWEVEGDFFPIWTYGFRLYPVFTDNGGLTVVLLSLTIMGLLFRAPTLAQTWVMALASGITLIAVYRIISWVPRRIEAGSIIGPPELQIGLMFVFLGALLIIAAGFWKLRLNNQIDAK